MKKLIIAIKIQPIYKFRVYTRDEIKYQKKEKKSAREIKLYIFKLTKFFIHSAFQMKLKTF